MRPPTRGGREREVLLDQLVGEAQDLEDLRGVVALHRGDAHLGHDGDDARRDGAVVGGAGLLGSEGELAAGAEVGDALMGQVGVDAARRVAHQAREVVRTDGVAGLHHEVGAGAQAAADEVVVHAPEGQKRRDRRLAGARAVGDHDDVGPGAHVPLGRAGQLVEGALEGTVAAVRRVDRAHRLRAEARAVDRADALEVGPGEHGAGQAHEAAGVAAVLEEVAVVTEVEHRARDEALAQGVDRRVGHLGEELVEVVEERARLGGEAGERRVHAHGGQRHRALLGHRAHDLVHVVVVPAVGGEARGERRGVGGHGRLRLRRLRQVGDVDCLLVEPVAVRLLARQTVADLVVAHDATGHGVNLEHLTGAETARAQDVGGLDVDGAHLGGQDQTVVARHVVARGAQAVPVERGAQRAPVGEDDRGGAVPGLHEHGLVGVVGAALVAERGVLVPGLRHHERDRAVERPSVHDEKLEHVVQDRGVRALAVDDRQHARQVRAQRRRVEARLACANPAHVAAQGIDLAVVDDVAVGMRALPGGRRVGGVARVHEGERRLHGSVVQIQVEATHLGGDEHALVDDRATGHAADVEDLAGERGRGVGGALDRAAADVEAALEVQAARHVLRAAQERLVDRGHAGLRRGSQVVRVNRHRAPEHERHAALRAATLEDLARRRDARRVVVRQEQHGHAVVALVGQELALLLRLLAEEAVRQLKEHARAVAGVLLQTLAAAVLQVHENRQRVVEGLMAANAVQVRDGTDAAGVVLVGLAVEAAVLGHGTPLRWFQGESTARAADAEKSETNLLRARHARVSRPPSARRSLVTGVKRSGAQARPKRPFCLPKRDARETRGARARMLGAAQTSEEGRPS